MNFNYFQLEAFVATVETGSFSAAARRLEKAQSAVSTAIMNLEIDLGVQLFNRDGKYPVITSDGQNLLRDIQYILDVSHKLQEKADHFSGDIESSLTIIVDEITPSSIIMAALNKFYERYPNVEITILNAAQFDDEDLIKSGVADLGLIISVQPPFSSSNSKHIGNIKALPVVSTAHPLAKLNTVSVKDLYPHLQLVYTDRTGKQNPNENRISRHVWSLESCFTTKKVILYCQAWGYLPENMIQEELKKAELKLLPLDFEKTDVFVYQILVWREQQLLGPATRYFISLFD